MAWLCANGAAEANRFGTSAGVAAASVGVAASSTCLSPVGLFAAGVTVVSGDWFHVLSGPCVVWKPGGRLVASCNRVKLLSRMCGLCGWSV